MLDLRGRTALIVEDEAVLALFVEDCLHEFGMQVLSMPSCVAEALSCLASCRPDVAIVDLNLGGSTAEPVIERLGTLGLPYLVVTGYGDDGGPVHCPDVPVLAKPYEVAELRTAITKLLSSQQGPVRDIAC